MKTRPLFLLMLLLSACTTAVKPSDLSSEAVYPDLGPAPELEGENWLNTEAPLRLGNLQGNVILLDMWTFG